MTLYILGASALLVLALVAFYASRFQKVGPNEVLIVSGRKTRYVDPKTNEQVVKNFRIFHGGGTFVLPIREKVSRMSVELMTLEIRTPEFFTKFGVPIVVDGIAQIKVLSDDPIATATAAEMFLSKTRAQMNEIAHQMMQGHLRAVISTLPFEEIHANPEAFAQTVQRLTAADLANMGIQVVSFTIRAVQDPSGYLTALGRPQLANVHKDATVGEATADLAKIEAELGVASARADRDRKLRQFEAQVAAEKAAADIAYDLQHARSEQMLIEEQLGVSRVQREKQIEIEELEIRRKELELEHSVRKPAEAQRYQIESIAEAQAKAARLKGQADADARRAALEAEADGMRAKAEAWKQYNQAAMGQMLIEKLPQIAEAVASPLQKIDRIVLVNNGSGDDGIGIDRITQGITRVIAQLPAMAETLSGVNLKEMVEALPTGSAPTETASTDEELDNEDAAA